MKAPRSQAGFLLDHWAKLAVALLLTFASGTVDIIGYQGVYHLFTAHLTGTTVQLGSSLVIGERRNVYVAIVIVAAFFIGSVVGRAIIGIGARTQVRKIASVTLGLEAILLVVVIYMRANPANPYGSMFLLASAMGLQTATLTGIGPLTVHTTFVTGMINKVGQLVSRVSFRAYDIRVSKISDPRVREEQRREIQMLSFLVGIWIFYLAGAAFGAWTFALWGLHALFVAVALLLVSLATDQFRQLSVREEIEQSEQ